jgi:hypothetical protein
LNSDYGDHEYAGLTSSLAQTEAENGPSYLHGYGGQQIGFYYPKKNEAYDGEVRR